MGRRNRGNDKWRALSDKPRYSDDEIDKVLDPKIINEKILKRMKYPDSVEIKVDYDERYIEYPHDN